MADAKNKIWCTDFTYIRLSDRKMRYNCTIIDLYDRCAVASLDSSYINTELAIDTLKRAINNEKPGSELIPELPKGLNDILDGNRVKRYLKYTLYPLMEMFGKDKMPMVDEHLTNYYQLTDERRRDVDQFIKAQLQIKKMLTEQNR